MKKIIIAVLSIIFLTIPAIYPAASVQAAAVLAHENTQVVQYAEAAAVQAPSKALEAGSATGQVTGFMGYSENECFAIVPCCAGGSSVDRNGDGNVKIHKTHRNPNQLWRIKRDGQYYYIESAYNNTVLMLPNGDTSNGNKLKATDTYWPNYNYQWIIEDAGDGTYFIRYSYNPNKVIDIEGDTSANGTCLMIYDFHGQRNQRFMIIPVSTVEPMDDWGASRHDCYGNDWDFWDGSIDNSWYYADQNARTYNLSTAAQLAGLSQLVRDGICTFSGRLINLTRDIDLAGVEWRRIGFDGRPFRGSFNGNGHSIIGLSVTTTDSQDGFFGQVEGACIYNFAIKGSISGDWNTGGVVGNMSVGILANVYSEVSITRALDDNCGGLCGRLGSSAMVIHCTQNARVNSGDKDPDRGGIAGYACGLIRYCVNMQTIDCNWNYVGGIAGECAGGKIEYSANYGQVCGGDDTQYAGGICGQVKDDGIVFGCYNSGYIYSSGDDYIGGIAGNRKDDGKVFCCINTGYIEGRDRVGGITGDGWCKYCFNAGRVVGDDEVGAVSGSAASLNWCRSLSWTTGSIHGEDGNKGAEWRSAEEVLSGYVCYEINGGEAVMGLDGYGPGYTEVFYQNIGGDPIPQFTGQKVYKNGNTFTNNEYEVRTECQKDYGTIEGGGSFSSGSVTLKAVPDMGCVFDHFEVSTTKVENRSMYSGTHGYPAMETQTYTEPEITITDNITKSYSVKAVYKIYDDTPADLKVSVKVEIECTDDVDGWNSTTVPIYLVDTAGERHLWEIHKDSIDGDGKKVDHTFDLGTASPVSLEVWPDFGGGITFRSLELQARMWINNSGQPYESKKVTIRSYPFISSKYGNDYMHLTFGDSGSSTVGTLRADGSLNVTGTYTKCSDAWEAARKLGNAAVIRLDSPWLLTERLINNTGNKITIDLNGFPIIRSIKKLTDNGEVIEVYKGSTVEVIDGNPTRKSCSSFTGGSIQGGRSKNGAGLVDVGGTFRMTGGVLYNGGTGNDGGAIRVVNGGIVELNGTMIKHCWANDNDGGAIYLRENSKVTLKDCTVSASRADKGGGIFMKDGGSAVTLVNTKINGCNAIDGEGGGVYIDDGAFVMESGAINSCQSKDDNAGGIYQNGGTVNVRGARFENNYANNSGGAVYINTNNPSLFRSCEFINNTCDDDGSAIYLDDNYLYMEDCRVEGNASKDKGAIYLTNDGSIDLCGTSIIRGNDGKDSFDNLVMEKDANIYDQGISYGSEIHVRCTKNGKVELSSSYSPISEYAVKNYFVSDAGGLGLTDTKEVNTDLAASAFSDGIIGAIAGGALVLLIIVGFIIYLIKKRKGAEA